MDSIAIRIDGFEVLRALLLHTSTLFLREASLDVCAASADHADILERLPLPATLRALTVRGDALSVGDLSPLWPKARGLTSLRIQAFAELGELELLELRALELRAPGSSKFAPFLEGVLRARLPSLERLTLRCYEWVSDPPTLADVRPLLDARFERLAHLAVLNFADCDGLVRALARSALLPRLESLDLSGGALSDQGALMLFDPSFERVTLEIRDTRGLPRGLREELRQRRVVR